MYRNSVQVILTNHSGRKLAVWSPLWENSTGEVLAYSPVASEIYRPLLGYPRREGELEAWGEPSQSFEVDVNQTICCQVALLEPSGEGIKRRLETRRTGTLVLPIKTESRLAVQRVQI